MTMLGRGAYTFRNQPQNVLYFDEVEEIKAEDNVLQSDLNGIVTSLVSTQDFFNSLRAQFGFREREIMLYDIAENAINHYMKASYKPETMFPITGIVPAKTWDGYDMEREEYFDVKSHDASINKPNSKQNLTLSQWHMLKNNPRLIHQFFKNRAYVSEMTRNNKVYTGIKVTPKQFYSAQINRSSVIVIVYYGTDPNIYILRYSGNNRTTPSRASPVANARGLIVSGKRSRTN